jgi:hypothetical protein
MNYDILKNIVENMYDLKLTLNHKIKLYEHVIIY